MKAIENLITELTQEIQNIKNRKPVNITLKNSIPVKQFEDYYILPYQSESEINIRDNTPAIITKNNKETDCIIISTREDIIQLAIQSKTKPNIQEGQLKIQTQYLENLKHTLQNFNLNQEKLHKILKTKLTVIPNQPHPKSSDKIVGLLKEMLKNGKQTLLLSHSNHRLDQILLKSNFSNKYKNEELVRFGLPSPDQLEDIKNQYQIINPQRSGSKNSGLVLNVDKNAKKITIEKSDDKTNTLEQKSKTIKNKLSGLNQRKLETEQELASINVRINQLENKLQKLQKAGALKKLLNHPNPDNLKHEIEKSKREKNRLELRLNGIKNAIETQSEELEVGQADISQLHNKDNVQKIKTNESSRDQKYSIIDIDGKRIIQNARLLITTTNNYLKYRELNNTHFDRIIIDFPADCSLAEIYSIIGKSQSKIILLESNNKNNIENNIFSLLNSSEKSINSESVKKDKTYSASTFQKKLYIDMEEVRNELIIICSALAPDKIEELQSLFQVLQNHKIDVNVVTRPPSQQPQEFVPYTNNCIKALKFFDITVKFAPNITENIIILDHKIIWEGNINILGAECKNGTMQRSNKGIWIKTIYAQYNLKELFQEYTLMGQKCPDCEIRNIDNYIIVKSKDSQSNQKYYCCSSFPACQWQADIQTRHLTPSDNLQSYQMGLFDSPSQSQTNKEWETDKRFWSSTKKEDYIYSPKNDAWYKAKD